MNVNERVYNKGGRGREVTSCLYPSFLPFRKSVLLQVSGAPTGSWAGEYPQSLRQEGSKYVKFFAVFIPYFGYCNEFWGVFFLTYLLRVLGEPLVDTQRVLEILVA